MNSVHLKMQHPKIRLILKINLLIIITNNVMSNIQKTFKEVLLNEKPLQIAGVINAYCALLAERAGFQSLYLSGAGIANACFGIPDIGLTHFNDVLTEAKRITQVTNLPLLVDIDTGFEHEIDAAALMAQMNTINVAAIQIEDQVEHKRCGHLAGKQLITIDKMQQRLAKFTKIHHDSNIAIMARTDAYLVNGFDETITRAIEYQSTGIDMIFVESLASLEQYSQITSALDIPVLANITEFGKTPLFTVDELATANIAMVLYPLTAFRVMNQAAQQAYQTLRETGSQKQLIDKMQTRDELYDVLNYKPNSES